MPTRHRITRDTTVAFSQDDNIFEEVATRERSIDFHSALYYLPNPDPVLKKTGQDISVYNELLLDPSVSAAVSSFKDGVNELEWDIDRGKSKSRQAKIIKQIFTSIDNNDERGGLTAIVEEILNARLFGYQPCEIMWEKVGGMIVPVDVVAKPQHWFTFNSQGQLEFRRGMDREVVPDMKFLLPTYRRTYDNPYGKGVLSSCFWPVTFKKGGMKFFVQFVEKYGMPYIIGKHKFQKKEDVASFVADLDAMVQDGVIAIAEGNQTVEVVQTGGMASADIYTSLVNVMRAEISHAILNHNAATSSTPGMLGNDTGASETRTSAVKSGKRLVMQAMNVLIKWTYELNGLSGDVPKFILFEEDDVDMVLAERDEKLVGGGVKFTKSYYIKNYGLEEEDFELSETPPPAPPAQFAEKSDFPDQQVVDDIGDLLSDAKATKATGDKVIQALLEFIDGSKSYEDALSGLASVYPKMKIDDIEKILVNASKAAMAIGRIHAHE